MRPSAGTARVTPGSDTAWTAPGAGLVEAAAGPAVGGADRAVTSRPVAATTGPAWLPGRRTLDAHPSGDPTSPNAATRAMTDVASVPRCGRCEEGGRTVLRF